MCWNPIASASFSLIYGCFNAYYYFVQPPHWKQYLIFSSFYFVMEVFQTCQWLFGEVLEIQYLFQYQMGIKFCPKTNAYFTWIAFILIWLQPVMFAYIGKISNNSLFFQKYYPICWLVFFYALLNLGMGSVLESRQFYSIEESIYGLSTCTTKMDQSYLMRRFRPYMVDYDTNHFVYLFLCFLSFVFYPKDIRIIGYGWLASLFATFIILEPSNVELMASWCLLSIVGNFIIMLKIYS